MTGPLLELEEVVVRYRARDRGRTVAFDALRSVSLNVLPGESVGIVGESGSGKSTIARAALALAPLYAGRVLWRGLSLAGLAARRRRELRRHYQLVFQNPAGSLNPRLPLQSIVREPLDIHDPRSREADRDARALAMLDRVGLAAFAARYPHELSGGQCQRAAIARAMVATPSLIVCDEPLSALDVSIQRQIIGLLAALRRESSVAYLLISHNLAVVQLMCTRVVVMYLGRIVECGPVDALFGAPLHPYTRALLDAVPTLDPERERAPRRVVVSGDVPSPITPPAGCAFHPRCSRAIARCRESGPALQTVAGTHAVACHRAAEWPAGFGGDRPGSGPVVAVPRAPDI